MAIIVESIGLTVTSNFQHVHKDYVQPQCLGFCKFSKTFNASPPSLMDPLDML